jgi:hypothetical protein
MVIERNQIGYPRLKTFLATKGTKTAEVIELSEVTRQNSFCGFCIVGLRAEFVWSYVSGRQSYRISSHNPEDLRESEIEMDRFHCLELWPNYRKPKKDCQ